MSADKADTAIIIPARLSSTRMPEKMLRADTGRALITYAVDAAEHARKESGGRVAHVLVATDDEKILKVVNSYAEENGLDARAVMTDAGHRSGSDRIAEVAEGLGDEIEIIINIQGDEPDLPAADILRVAELLRENESAAMSTMVRPLYKSSDFVNPNNVKAVRDNDGFCLYFSRAPIPYDRECSLKDGDVLGELHLGIYGYRRPVLLGYKNLPESNLEGLEKLEQLRALSAGLRIVADRTDYDGIGIDTEEDYQTFVARANV